MNGPATLDRIKTNKPLVLGDSSATLAFVNRTAQDASLNGAYIRWIGVKW